MSLPIHIQLRCATTPVVENIRKLLEREIRERGEPVNQFAIELDIQPRTGGEGFRIDSVANEGVRITGESERGLLFGIGKLLHASGRWSGESAPDKPVRGMCFAVHFHNFYHEAPVAEIERYVEELALWGLNSFLVWFDLHHFEGISDPKAQAMLSRLNAILGAARRLGLDTGILVVPNAAYANSPASLRAKSGHRGAVYPVDLCLAHDESRRLVLRWFDEQLDALESPPNYLVLWPYDSGGCGCDKCRPWGTNGFLEMSEAIARRCLQRSADTKVILSTWFFDNAEWAGLAGKFRVRPDWCHYIMTDDFRLDAAEHPLVKGVPGDLPILTFPEISMWGAGGWGPWGGCGANPFPGRLQQLWDKIGAKVAGGFPYSEGIFEDMNKVVCAQQYWNLRAKTDGIIREYIASHFSESVVEPVSEAIHVLEETLRRTGHDELRKQNDKSAPARFAIHKPERVQRAWELIQKADVELAPAIRNSWRWRILYLRGLVDSELDGSNFTVSDRCEEALRELTSIYHAEHAASPVAPPTREALHLNRGI